jgi:hypothetical protein
MHLIYAALNGQLYNVELSKVEAVKAPVRGAKK